MEVLFGYLFLTGQKERLDFLFRLGYGLAETDAANNFNLENH
jgi:23S rRNA maturation mini-RNase III